MLGKSSLLPGSDVLDGTDDHVDVLIFQGSEIKRVGGASDGFAQDVDAKFAEVPVLATDQPAERFDHVAGPALQHGRALGPHKRIVVSQQLDHGFHWTRGPHPGEPA